MSGAAASHEVTTDDIATLYQALQQYRREVRRDQRLPVPPAESVTVHDKVCGSQVTLDAHFAGDHLSELGYRVRACSLGQASTAILARRAPGLDAGTLERIHEQLRKILAGQDTRCDWPELEIFALTREIPGRRGSAELPFHALKQLFHRAGLAGVSMDRDVATTTHSFGGNEP